MALVLADRVRETSTTTGTGEMTLLGAVTGYRAFSSVMATSDTCYYCIANRGSTEWEVGVGTFNAAGHLTRDTVLSSSNSGSLVSFSAGTKDVFIDMPAEKLMGPIVAGTQTASTMSVSFANSNGVSFGMSNNSVITASVSAQSAGFYAVGNTTQNSSTTLDIRTVSFNGLGAATMGFSNGSIQVSVPVQTNQSIGYFAVGNTTQNSSTTRDARSVSFNGLGIITVGFSNGSIQLSATQSTQVISFFGLGNTTQNSSSAIDARSVSFNGLGAMTVGFSNNSIQLSVPVQTNQSLGFYAVGNTTQNSSTTFDARTVSFNGLGDITVGYSNGSVQISGTQTNQTLGIYAISNTTGAATSSTYDARSLSIQGAGFVSVGHTNGSVVISVTTLISSAQSNQSIGFYAVGNTTQNSSTTLDARTVSFRGIGDVSVGYSNGTIQISVDDPQIVNWENIPLIGTTTYTPGAGTWYFEPFFLPADMSGGRINRHVAISSGTANILPASSSASFSSATTGSRSASFIYGNSLALYSLGAGTNSTRLETFWSNTFTFAISHSVSVASGGATSLTVTNGATLSYIVSIDASGNYTTTSFGSSTTRSSASAAMAISAVSAGVSSIVTFLGGAFQLPVGLNTTVTAGNYWLAQAWNTSSTTAGTNGTVLSVSNQTAVSIASMSAPRLWGQTTTTANSMNMPGQGQYTSTSASPPATVNFASISVLGTNMRQYFNFVNSTI